MILEIICFNSVTDFPKKVDLFQTSSTEKKSIIELRLDVIFTSTLVLQVYNCVMKLIKNLHVPLCLCHYSVLMLFSHKMMSPKKSAAVWEIKSRMIMCIHILVMCPYNGSY